MKIKLFGIKLTVSYLFCAFICLMLLCDKTGLFIPMLLAVLIHEGGHLLFMWLYDCAPTEIKLIPGSVQLCAPICSGKPSLLISLSGPIANIIVFILVFGGSVMQGDDYYLTFAFVNLIYGVFNLLPLIGLDGGTALKEALINKKGEAFALRVLSAITVCAAVFSLSFAIFMSIIGRVNYSAYILSLYLVLSVLLKF